MLDALGQTYQGLGLPDAAVRLMERAGAVREKALGPGHPDTIRTRAVTTSSTRNTPAAIADAVKLGEATFELADVQAGPRSSRHDRVPRQPGHRLSGRRADRPGYPDARGDPQLREAKLGHDHKDTLTSRNALADSLAIAGHTTEAIRLLRADARASEAKLGPDHPQTLNLRNNLAVAYFEAGRFRRRDEVDEGTLRIREVKLGPDHPDTLTVRNNLAQDYENLGRFAEGLAMNEGTLRPREAKLGPDHPDTLVQPQQPRHELSPRRPIRRGDRAPRSDPRGTSGEARARPPRHAG